MTRKHLLSARQLLTLLCCLLPTLATVSAQATLVPRPPQVEASGYILMDAASGQVIVEHNADEALPPASLTKIMTDYIAAREIAHGNLRMDDKVTISVKAWRMGGSRMFVREGTQVRVEDLIKGMLEADVVGFHSFDNARHFLTCCQRLLGLATPPVVVGRASWKCGKAIKAV